MAAFLLAPLIPPLIMIIPSAIAVLRGNIAYGFSEVAHSALLGYAISALATVLLGIPAFLFGKWLGRIRWRGASIAGFVIGLIVGLHIGGYYLDSLSLLLSIFLFGIPGAFSGWVFWLIWSLGHREQVNLQRLHT